MVQEVQVLNKKIENINVQRTKAEAKVDMLKKQLMSEIGAYKKTYGVDLSDKNFAKLSGKVKAELSLVSESIKAEFELKEKVVEAIEQGNYEEAYKLLGIKVDTDDNEVSVEESVSIGNVSDSDFDSEDSIDLDFGVEEEDDGNSAGKSFLDAVNQAQNEPPMSVVDDLQVEDEEELEKPTSVKGESALDAVGSMEVEDSDSSDIPDMGDEDWGFGDILSGTQFEN